LNLDEVTKEKKMPAAMRAFFVSPGPLKAQAFIRTGGYEKSGTSGPEFFSSTSGKKRALILTIINPAIALEPGDTKNEGSQTLYFSSTSGKKRALILTITNPAIALEPGDTKNQGRQAQYFSSTSD